MATISALLLLLSSLPHVVDASAFVPTITTTLSNTRFVRHCRNDIFDTSINARPRKSSSSSTTMDISTITTPQTTTASTTTTTPTIQLPSWTHHSEEDVIAVIIDAENVRGRTGFELDHADLLDRLLVWTSMRYGYAYGKTIVVIDHGSQAGAIVLREEAIKTLQHCQIIIYVYHSQGHNARQMILLLEM